MLKVVFFYNKSHALKKERFCPTLVCSILTNYQTLFKSGVGITFWSKNLLQILKFLFIAHKETRLNELAKLDNHDRLSFWGKNITNAIKIFKVIEEEGGY